MQIEHGMAPAFYHIFFQGVFFILFCSKGIFSIALDKYATKQNKYLISFRSNLRWRLKTFIVLAFQDDS